MFTAKKICAFIALFMAVPMANAQFSELVTDFETNGAGVDYLVQPSSLGDLEVVVFQDPAEADATELNILADGLGTNGLGSPSLPSTEESFVATFLGFSGANGSPNFLDIRFQWTANTNGNRWALIETLQSPIIGDPSVHLDGKVRMYVNIPNCAQFEFPGEFTLPSQIGVALLISETGRNVPQGRQDNDVLNGDLEFVGVTSVAFANTANPVPRPSTFIPITDAGCAGATTGPAGNWRLVEFDLTTANVVGWTFEGGDGVLDATSNGDMVNRGVVAGLVLTVPTSDTTSDFVEFLVDQIEFEAPVTDPATRPSIAEPVIVGHTSIQVNEVLSRATSVVLEIDRTDMDDEDPFVADETYPDNSPLPDPANELRYVQFTVPQMEIGDRVRARQAIGGDVSTNSLVVAVNPPAAFSATLSLDEDGNGGGAPADFEFVGSASGTPNGKPVFPQNGVWQKVQFSLIPGVEPVANFAGGDGLLSPDGGQYNVDAMFFTIDGTSANQGPFDVFIDHVFVIDAGDNEILLGDAETINPFPSFRGQSTSINNSSTLSTLASFDGISSNRIQWEWPDAALDNIVAPFRPQGSFADTAKAVGMWVLVEDAKTTGLPLPEVDQQIIGEAPLVTVSNICTNATQVILLVNGVDSGMVDPMGATEVDIAPNVTLALGDSVSAVADCGTSGLTDTAYARAVRRPAAPVVPGPLFENQTAVTVNGILNTGNAIASLVSLYDGNTLLDTIDPMGAGSVQFTLNPGLLAGQQINAVQTVNNLDSAPSAPVGVGSGVTICVTINEIQYDDEGADDREFVELYNADPDPVDISNWVLRSSDTVAPPADNNPDYTIPPATVLASGDYYVVGDPSVANVDFGIAGGTLWEDDNEAIELLDSNGVVVDTVVYEFGKGPVAVSPAEGGIWGNFQSISGASSPTPQSLGRWVDGVDTDNNGRDFGFIPQTPGETNVIPLLAPVTQNFDGFAAPTDVANWSGSFVTLRHANPAVVDAGNVNPNVIPASPQGGNVAICWDPAGGGNQCVLSDEARYNVGFTAQVYIDTNALWVASNGTASEDESWSIGIGTVDTFHNRFGFVPNANGDTGLNWQFLIREAANTGSIGLVSLQLVDENDGGDDSVVRLDIPRPMITTGWHTLSITRNFENFTASYDAISTTGVLAGNGPGVVSMGYREFVEGIPASLRPVTIDNLSVTVPTAPTLGGCCSACGCRLLTQAECSAQGDSYGGDGTDCSDGNLNGMADTCDALAAPEPTIVGPLCENDVLVEVTGLVPAASDVTLYEAGVNPIATAQTGGAATVRVHVPGGLTSGDSITATQTVGGFEGMQSAAEVVIVCPGSFCVESYSDDFDSDTSAAWTVNTSGVDTAYQFAYDYSADGVPPSPNGGGTTMGLKVEVNIINPSGAEFVIATPNGVNPSGSYRVEVDYWMNYPIGSTTGTEFLGAGVGYDGVTANLDGNFLYYTSDGGSTRDYSMFKEGAEQRIGIPLQGDQYTITSQDNLNPAIAAAFPGQMAPVSQGQAGTSPNGAQSFAWRTLAITVDADFETINFQIDGFDIGTLVCGGEYGPVCDVGGAIQLFYADRFATISTNAALQFGIFDNFRVVTGQPTGGMMGDWDGDNDVDVDDWIGMAACLEGPGVTPTLSGCSDQCLDVFDYDLDLDVDLDDVAEFTDDF